MRTVHIKTRQGSCTICDDSIQIRPHTRRKYCDRCQATGKAITDGRSHRRQKQKDAAEQARRDLEYLSSDNVRHCKVCAEILPRLPAATRTCTSCRN